MPMVDVALGAALVAMCQEFPVAPTEIAEKHEAAAADAFKKGARMDSS